MTQDNTIIRVRNRDTAHAIARRMAGMTARTFGVQKYDARTWAVSPQRQDLQPGVFQAYVRLAKTLKKLGDN